MQVEAKSQVEIEELSTGATVKQEIIVEAVVADGRVFSLKLLQIRIRRIRT